MAQNFKLDLWSLYVPTYQISILRGPVAFILTPGKDIVVRKMPKKREYFIDKNLGLFQIKPEYAFTLNKSTVYFYDMRNQNTIDPLILNDLWKWANAQGIFKIRRVDVKQAIELRSKDSTILKEEREKARLTVRAFMHKVLESIEEKNKATEAKKEAEAGLSEDKDEYKKISPEDSQFLIVQNLYEKGYIDAKEATILNHKLTKKEIQSTDQLLDEIDSFNKVFVNRPIPIECERILDDFHTYRPRDVIGIIKEATKINKGLKGLRTKPIVNWFPAMYILFGALAIGIIIMLYFTYAPQGTGGVDLIHPK